jgi:hypothetical protein
MLVKSARPSVPDVGSAGKSWSFLDSVIAGV